LLYNISQPNRISLIQLRALTIQRQINTHSPPPHVNAIVVSHGQPSLSSNPLKSMSYLSTTTAKTQLSFTIIINIRKRGSLSRWYGECE